MIDIHTHLLFGIDDGAKDYIETLKMLEAAQKAGLTGIIVTPHFMAQCINCPLFQERFDMVYCAASQMGIELKKGFELKIDPFIPGLAAQQSDIALNSSKYILIELPADSFPFYTFEILFKLQIMNFVPIIAHPERNAGFIKDYSLFMKLVETGCMIQVDSSSIVGFNGRKVKRMAKRIIVSGHAHFVASDAHDIRGYSDWYCKAFKKVKNWVGEKACFDLFHNNAASIIE
ncbi:MAG: tyrosine-protein phosphatase [Acetivibrionales bacterium]|jgi:protein-tyrosine phosphatase